jgi:hypothetical protein
MLGYLNTKTSSEFYHAENIERSLDKTSLLSFSNMNDYIRFSASIKIPTNVMVKREIVGTKDKYDHFPSNNFK